MKCDRCGQQFDFLDSTVLMSEQIRFKVSLCPDCMKSFRQWLNHGPCSDCVHVPDKEYDPCEDCMAYEDDGGVRRRERIM